jgi:hypothetical protein
MIVRCREALLVLEDLPVNPDGSRFAQLRFVFAEGCQTSRAPPDTHPRAGEIHRSY